MREAYAQRPALRLSRIGSERPRRRRVLVINAFFDDLRRDTASPNKIPQAMAPFYVAGTFRAELCEVRVYSEHHSGPLRDHSMLAWPDMLVLTGLNVAFDRMLHLSAYARSCNPALVVVAGGHAIRALPNRARRYFDYACAGDVEQMRDVIRDTFGADYVADELTPRYDLVRHNRWLGYAETSRNCNFQCSFCTMAAEGNGYYKYALEDLRRHIIAMGPKPHVLFLDNNFYGGNHGFFRARMELLRELHREGRFGGWSAMVTNDFFVKQENLDLARRAGCRALFSGVESFDTAVLSGVGKRQNLVLPQFDVIRRCLDAGIMFHYGMIFDLSARRISEIRQEIELVLETPGVPLPSFVSMTIPLLGTPYFRESVARETLLPRVKLRDLDGFTLSLTPLDPMDEAIPFARDLPSLRGYRTRVMRKTLDVLRRNYRSMNWFQLMLTSANAFLLCAPNVINAPLLFSRLPPKRSYVSTTEPIDPLYTPEFPVQAKFRDHFIPTMVTDREGMLASDLLLDYRPDGQRVGAYAAARAVADRVA